MTTPQQDTGKIGENLAKTYLEEKGYKILHENWRQGILEIDLIAKSGQLLIFVEVKTRKANSLIEPHMAVNKAKQQTLIRAAKAFVGRYGVEDEVRFDIVAVSNSDSSSEIEHIEDAFRATGR